MFDRKKIVGCRVDKKFYYNFNNKVKVIRTLNNAMFFKISDNKLQPPERIDSLPSRSDDRSRSPRDPRMTVQVLTHNGSMSETSE